MPLEIFVDNLDSVPESLRADFVEHDGRFRLEADDLDSAIDKQVAGLKGALAKEREANREIKSLGRAPSEIRALLADIDASAADSAVFKTLLAQHESKWAVDRAALENELRISRSAEHTVLRETLVEAGLKNAKATKSGHEILGPLLADRVRLDAVENKRVVTIINEDGKTPMLRKDGKPATFADLVGEMVKAYPSQFEGSGAGGGSPSKGFGPSDGKRISRAEFDQLTPIQRSQKMLSGYILYD